MIYNSKILVVDDDPDICEILKIILTSANHYCHYVSNAEDAFAQIDAQPWDLVILDVMLPTKDGFAICKQLREQSNLPVLFLTSKDSKQDQTQGFVSGGDDYLTKPFSKDILLARVNAILRRYLVYQGKDNLPTVEELEVQVYDKELLELRKQLTDLEDRILMHLHTHRGSCCSAKELYESVWHEPSMDSSNNTVMVHIWHLRKKLEKNHFKHLHIRTIWGKGYQIDI